LTIGNESLLLDTQAIILWSIEPGRLPKVIQDAIANPSNTIYFSSVSAMEIATKVRIGKLEKARALVTDFADQLVAGGFIELPLSAAHAEMAGSFSSANNDPWDRLLAAQARIERMGFVTSDGKMDDFGVRIIWK
jgi:PIN domain nuclease of toxin-antitoxin system